MARARNQRGEGCYDKLIDKNGNLLFYRWRIGIYDPVDRKTRYKSIKAKNRDALEKKVSAWKETNGDRGALPPSPKRMTVRQWVERWLAVLENKIAQATYARYRDTAEHHILPHFGSLWLSEVTPLMLQAYFDNLSETYALATVSTIRGHFRTCFAKAVKFEILSRNPVVSTDPPKGEKPTLKVLEEAEVARILEVARECTYRPPARSEGDEYIMKRDYLMILLAVSSGMRKGEILGLTWPCVNGTQIEVKHSLQANLIGVKRKLKGTKNGKTRTITIPESVAKKLKEWQEYQAAYAEKYRGIYKNELSLVFTSVIGTLVDGGYFTNFHFRSICSTAGVGRARFHDLRHFWASSALSKGVPVQIVSEQLGHSSIAITYNRYTHVLQKSRDELKVMLDENPLFKNG